MKFTVAREQLASHLGVAVRAVSARSSIPTLSGVLVDAASGGVELNATDMELGVRVRLGAEAEREGRVVLPGRLFLDVVRSLPNEHVQLELEPSRQSVQVSAGGARFDLRTLPADEFPKLPDPDVGSAVSLPTAAFVDTVARVARAASRDEARPHLTGVLVSASGDELRMVATDSYRLSVKETRLESPVTGELELNVPVRALQEVSRIAGVAPSGDLAISARENQVVFTLGDVVLSSRLIEGRFPNYKQLLPETYEHELRLSRSELLDVVRRISLLAQKNAPLRLKFEEGQLEVSAQTPDIGEARESLPVPFSGEALEIGFNPTFLQDGLDSAESDDLVLKLISPGRPGLIQSGDDGGFLYLVMPVRLNV